jgi:hypothetical protein
MFGLILAALLGGGTGYTVAAVVEARGHEQLRQRMIEARRQARTAAPAAVRQQVDQQMRSALTGAGLTRERADAAYALARRAGLV